MSEIPDFTEGELKVVDDTLRERYGNPIETQRADIEVPVHPDDDEVIECPAIYWQHGECHFILSKAGEQQFFSQFFYGDDEQFGTGKEFYDDVRDCLMTTLKVQADHELKRKGVIKS
ncbi:MAG: hypothetical protein OEZ39_02785 [Gammaproteobacteria bacterium]|nr:hypothetical protein [Gammaproteobacteria bacterium]MDH5650782.1 hypothetical protein [Gammaproteobacteria bacterium]